jgi:hypothetical protein
MGVFSSASFLFFAGGRCSFQARDQQILLFFLLFVLRVYARPSRNLVGGGLDAGRRLGQGPQRLSNAASSTSRRTNTRCTYDAAIQGLLAVLRAAAPRAFDATTFAVALAAFYALGQRLDL